MISKYRSNQVRIIAGQWRGRRIRFPDITNLRPSADMVRETLFNWLSPHIQGQSCLDLFAGSGALGFEALSRGAAYVQMVDSHPAVVKQLRATAVQLQTENVDIIQGIAPQCLKADIRQPFDIVFLDPPFGRQLITACSQWLEENDYLARNARIYVETEQNISNYCLPEHWQILYNKQSGRVTYCLLQRI